MLFIVNVSKAKGYIEFITFLWLFKDNQLSSNLSWIGPVLLVGFWSRTFSICFCNVHVNSLCMWESRLTGLQFSIFFMSPFMCSVIILASFHSTGIFFVFKIRIKIVICVTDSSPQIITLLVRLVMPGALLLLGLGFLFVSLMVFLTSDIIIGWTCEVYGLALSYEGCWSLERRTVQCTVLCKSVRRSLVFHLCLYFILGPARLIVCWACCSAWCSVAGSILLWASGIGDFSLGTDTGSDSIPQNSFGWEYKISL